MLLRTVLPRGILADFLVSRERPTSVIGRECPLLLVTRYPLSRMFCSQPARQVRVISTSLTVPHQSSLPVRWQSNSRCAVPDWWIPSSTVSRCILRAFGDENPRRWSYEHAYIRQAVRRIRRPLVSKLLRFPDADGKKRLCAWVTMIYGPLDSGTRTRDSLHVTRT